MAILPPVLPKVPPVNRRWRDAQEASNSDQAALDPPQQLPSDERLGYLLLGIALLTVLLFHGVLLFNQHFVSTYDALIHIFFGSHYAATWFDPWEPRWYTGFLTVAYPPLSHYLIALTSKLTGLLTAFAVVQLYALLQLTVGMFRFSRLLTSPVAAGFAAVALALSSALSETVHVFGQLPTTLSLGFLLNAMPFVWDYIQRGKKRDLLKAVLWTAATTAAHHVTTLFGSVFFTGPMVIILLLAAFRSPRPGEMTGEGARQRFQRRIYRLLPRLYRTALFGVLAISMLIIVVFPYWYWSGTDPILQVPIAHGSRANFLTNPNLGLIFWLIPWLSTIWFLPYAAFKGLSNWRWPVAASVLLLCLLGTGGTTPIPRLLLGAAFDILTLDRFTFWATILILPFVGMGLESMLRGSLKVYLDEMFGRVARIGVLLLLLGVTCLGAVSVSTLTKYRKIQPDPIDIDPIVNFIEKDEHWRYRYLTLGFGDQMAWLSANTRATTPDGNYHSARRLPELTSTPVERLEGAKYKDVPGIGSLEQFLRTPEKYYLKFVFSNDTFYDPLLYFNGWQRARTLSNGIVVWEREGFPPLPERLPRKTWPIYQRLMWGILPLLAAVLAYAVLFVKSRPDKRHFWQRWGWGKTFYRLLGEDALPEQPSGTWRGGWLEPGLRRLLRRRFFIRGSAALVFLVFAVWPTILLYQSLFKRQDTPQAAVEAYWDDMDFKRFASAYRWLEPQDGLDYDRWRLDISVMGGLRSGYAKLSDIHTTIVAYDGAGTLRAPRLGDRALVHTELTWFTAVAELTESSETELIRTRAGWRILAAPLLKTRPQERFAGQPDVSYYRAPRRLTTADSSPNDVLDRPRLLVLEARLVSYQTEVPDYREGDERIVTQFAVVGRLQNLDARPADLVVTAALLDDTGKAVSYNDAGTRLIHTLLPNEITPFRVDFDGVAAPLDPERIRDFTLFPNAVVTSSGLERSLASWSEVTPTALEARAVNLGTHEATVPQALLSLFDSDGLAWVSESYLPEAVPPREARSLTLTPALPQDYKVVSVFDTDSNLTFFSKLELPGQELISFSLKDSVAGLESYLLQWHAFYREAE